VSQSPKHARRFTAFDDSIVALYARGLTVREIQGYLAEAYGTEVGHDLISTVTDGVLTEVAAWQSRPAGAGLSGVTTRVVRRCPEFVNRR
jgi:transposase-like protein